jgi:hypothetical protein
MIEDELLLVGTALFFTIVFFLHSLPTGEALGTTQDDRTNSTHPSATQA